MKFLIIPNKTKESAMKYADEVYAQLTELGAESQIVYSAKEAYHSGLMQTCDAVIVLGGDGSILRTAKYASALGIPILGVNFGKIGYMADTDTNYTHELGRLLTGDYTVEERMMLQCSISGTDEIYYALNDFVIAHGTVSRVVSLSLSCDGEELYTYDCDGIIAATPTGSSAYSMSAGGAIIDPSLNCLLITPICPHYLGAKQLVFSPNCTLTVKNESSEDKLVYLTVDGDKNIQLPCGASVVMKRAERKTKLIRFTPDSFAANLSKKMKRRNL